MNETKVSGTLDLVVISGKDLYEHNPPKYAHRLCWVKVSARVGKEAHETNIHTDVNRDPLWKEHFQFHVSENDEFLHLEAQGKYDSYGQADLPITQLLRHNNEPVWCPLQPSRQQACQSKIPQLMILARFLHEEVQSLSPPPLQITDYMIERMQKYSIQPQEFPHQFSQSASFGPQLNSNARDCRSFHHCWNEESPCDQPIHHHRLSDLSENIPFNARALEKLEGAHIQSASHRNERRMSRPHILISHAHGDVNPLMPALHLHQRHDTSKYLIQKRQEDLCSPPSSHWYAPTPVSSPAIRSSEDVTKYSSVTSGVPSLVEEEEAELVETPMIRAQMDVHPQASGDAPSFRRSVSTSVLRRETFSSDTRRMLSSFLSPAPHQKSRSLMHSLSDVDFHASVPASKGYHPLFSERSASTKEQVSGSRSTLENALRSSASSSRPAVNEGMVGDDRKGSCSPTLAQLSPVGRLTHERPPASPSISKTRASRIDQDVCPSNAFLNKDQGRSSDYPEQASLVRRAVKPIKNRVKKLWNFFRSKGPGKNAKDQKEVREMPSPLDFDASLPKNTALAASRTDSAPKGSSQQAGDLPVEWSTASEQREETSSFSPSDTSSSTRSLLS